MACLLLRCAPGLDDGALRAAVERLRPLAQKRDIAFLIEDSVELARAVGADGVHLGMAVAYGEARRRLGPDAIVGVACGTRDEAIDVAEHGADYVTFGDFDDPSPTPAALDLTAWWGEIMTVPCVGTGCATNIPPKLQVRDVGSGRTYTTYQPWGTVEKGVGYGFTEIGRAHV